MSLGIKSVTCQQMHQLYHFDLRPYQEDAINSVKGLKHSLVCLPVGSGKTVIFTEIVKRFPCKTLIIVNKNILVENTLRGIPGASVYHASSGRKEFGQVTIACYQSLVNCKNLPDFDLVIIDEAHRYDLENNFFMHLRYKKLIEFSATPIGKIAPTFYRSLKSMTPQWLVPIKYSGKDMLDLSQVKINAGEYSQSGLEKAYKSINENIIKDMLPRIKGRKFVVLLCSTINHADEMAALLGCYVCHSRKDQRKEFEENGGILSSVMMLSEGYDFKPIDCVVFLRATRSEVLYMQAVGRGLRPSPGKDNCLVLDYGRIVQNLGDVYDIDFRDLKMKRPTARLCPQCENLTKRKICECGFEFYVEARGPQTRGINLTTESENDVITLYQVEARPYVSKAGNDCVKMTYYSDLFTIALVDYLPEFKINYLLSVLDCTLTEFYQDKEYQRIGAVKIKRNGKYKNVDKYYLK